MRITPMLTIAAAVCLSAAPALAATTPMSQDDMLSMMMMHHSSITVQGTGHVDYTPDIAHVTLGVSGEAPSAAAAAADIAGRANAVIAALKTLGVAEGDITTTGYSLFYRQPTETVKAAFVASENISVKTSVDKAGQAIDVGLRAGANQTYGLSFDTSHHDALYKQAVASAVKNARDVAQVAAGAAGVNLGSVMSIDVSAAFNPMQFVANLGIARMAAPAPAPPPVAPGTGTVSATVTMRFGIAPPGAMIHPMTHP
jgi:uncharacterized protein YggE